MFVALLFNMNNAKDTNYFSKKFTTADVVNDY